MAYPYLTAVVNAFPTTTLSVDLPAATGLEQTFALTSAVGWSEVDATGTPNGVPLGESGPFVVMVGTEKILCVSCENGIITVFNDGGVIGRGSSPTTPASASATVSFSQVA